MRRNRGDGIANHYTSIEENAKRPTPSMKSTPAEHSERLGAVERKVCVQKSCSGDGIGLHIKYKRAVWGEEVDDLHVRAVPHKCDHAMRSGGHAQNQR